MPGSGRPPGGGNGSPLQYSCLGDPTNRGPQLRPRGCRESDTTEATGTTGLRNLEQPHSQKRKVERWVPGAAKVIKCGTAV